MRPWVRGVPPAGAATTILRRVPVVSMVAGSTSPACGSAVESAGGTDYECRECGHEFDGADLFLP